MSTTDGMFSQYERQELNKITAKSILEKLMDIRQGIKDEFTARRLIWELIQNAKDNASLCNTDGEKVDVFIEITESEFIFSHNKGYFTNEHIRGLIRKYSSSDKDRDVEHIDQVYKTTGRFGTGFMTTHLLSEKVHIESYYKNDQGKYNEFNFWLDRSGKDEKGIIRGINNAFEEAEDSIKNSPNVILEKEDFYTSFIYPLTDRKRNLAYIALEEVKNGIGFTLINVSEINSVTIDEDAIGTTVYKIKLVDTITYQDNEFYVYNLLIGGKKSKYSYLTINEGELQIIIPISDINNKFHVLELNSDIPRFHLDFPMTGTEDLHLPFIVNTPLFEPTEPRDGVSLIDDEENPIAQKNCEIVIRAVDLFIIFLSYIGKDENWNDLYNLARIKSPKKQPWIDSIWFNDNVVSKIRKELLYTPIVDVTNGDRIAILDDEGYYQVCFPYAEKDIIREKIWGLSMKIQPQFTPIKEHINKWHEIIWKDCYKFTLSELSEEIEDKENLENLTELLGEKEKNAIDFLNTYYDLLNLEENHIKDIIADKYKVIPNQLGEFIKKSELFVEQEIDEELINACSLVTEDPRQVLRHKAIITASNYDNIDSKLKYSIKNQESIIADINKIIKERKNQNISLVCDYLASLFPTNDIPQRRKLIFGFSKKIYPEDFTEKRKLKYYDEKIWEESDKNSLFYIVSKIAEFKTVTQAAEGLCFADENAFITWLDKLISFLVKDGFENNINRRDHPILPNQNGDFCTKDDLFLDDGETDEILKDISAELGHDFREELLDLSIILELPENRTYTIEDVAEKISASIKPIIRDVENRKEYKDTLKKFYIWMNTNREKAEHYFSDLYERRFLFLEDDDISSNIKKATDFDKLMEEHGIEDIEDLRSRLSNTSNNDSSSESNVKVVITKDILVSLGISSPEELATAFKDPSISSRFYHTSIPTRDMFIYAQELIKRAKQNIIEHLQNHPDYDCTDLEETAPTTLAGITKNGIPIQIVTRPSDNGEVIIYYSSEKDTLDSDNSELWVDNSKNEPHILTLGRILKSTGISRIPINMN